MKKTAIVVAVLLVFVAGVFVGRMFVSQTPTPTEMISVTPVVLEQPRVVQKKKDVTIALNEDKKIPDENKKITEIATEVATEVVVKTKISDNKDNISDKIEFGICLGIFSVPMSAWGKPTEQVYGFNGMLYKLQINQMLLEPLKGFGRFTVGVGEARLSSIEIGLGASIRFSDYKGIEQGICGLEISGGWGLLDIDSGKYYYFHGAGPVFSAELYLGDFLLTPGMHAKAGVGYTFSFWSQKGQFFSKGESGGGEVQLGVIKMFTSFSFM